MTELSIYAIPGFKKSKEVEIGKVLKAVCEYFEITEDQLKTKTHLIKYAFPRFILSYILMTKGYSNDDIGELLNQDRTTS